MLLVISILCIVAAIVIFIYDEHKEDSKLAQQLYDNRVTFKDYLHFYCSKCDNIFHVKQQTCNKINFSKTLTVYYGKCPKCNKTCRIQRGR